MSGFTHIRTNESCPGCGKAFSFDQRIGFYCLPCNQFPRRFRIDVTWNGKRQKIYCNKQGQVLEGYLQALDLEKVVNEEISNGRFDPSKYRRTEIQRFWAKNLMDDFLTAKKKEIAPSYLSNYRVMTQSAKDFFRALDVREIRKVDLLRYKESLEGRSLSVKTVKNYLDHFRVFLRWCKGDLEIIGQVPTFPLIDVPEPDFIWVGRDDQIYLLDHVPELDKDFISFLMLHGCRPSEARALKCKDVILDSGTIKISSTFSSGEYRNRRKGRGAKPAIIPIHDECLAYITKRVQENLPEAWLFVNPRTGNHYTQARVRKIWDKVREKAGIDKRLRLYDATRHSVASQLRSGGADLEDIKDQLGQSCLRTTERYAHADVAKLKANLKKLSLKKVVPVRGVSVEGEPEEIYLKDQTVKD